MENHSLRFIKRKFKLFFFSPEKSIIRSLCTREVNKCGGEVIGLGEMSGGHLKSVNCEITLGRKRKKGERAEEEGWSEQGNPLHQRAVWGWAFGPAWGPPLALSL